MTRGILLLFGWLVAAFALWVLLVVLEIYWNLYDWQPKADSIALGLGFGIFSAVAGMWLLARARRPVAARGASLVMCLALLVLGVYVLPPEPLSTGLFAREQASPLWYRGGRLAVLTLTALCWVLAMARRRATTSTSPNGGLATQSSDPEVTKGPPSVS